MPKEQLLATGYSRRMCLWAHSRHQGVLSACTLPQQMGRASDMPCLLGVSKIGTIYCTQIHHRRSCAFKQPTQGLGKGDRENCGLCRVLNAGRGHQPSHSLSEIWSTRLASPLALQMLYYGKRLRSIQRMFISIAIPMHSTYISDPVSDRFALGIV